MLQKVLKKWFLYNFKKPYDYASEHKKVELYRDWLNERYEAQIITCLKELCDPTDLLGINNIVQDTVKEQYTEDDDVILI